MDTLLITGSNGYTARFLIDRWRQVAPGVRLITTDVDPATPAGSSRHVQDDLCCPQRLPGMLAAERPSVIVHLAAVPAGAPSDRLLAVNAGATAALYEVIRFVTEYHPRVLTIGSAGEYAPGAGPLDENAPTVPVTDYGRSKLAQTTCALHLGAKYEIPTVIARTFNFLGPDLPAHLVAGAFAEQIARCVVGNCTDPISVGDLSGVRDFLDIRDVVAAYEVLLTRGTPGTVYNVCSGVGHTIADLLAGMLRSCAKDLPRRVDPARIPAQRVDRCVGDPQRIRTELGWHPTISFAQSVRETLDHAIVTAKARRPLKSAARAET